MKEYEERKGSDTTSLREDIQLRAQQITKLERELREKDAETINTTSHKPSF